MPLCQIRIGNDDSVDLRTSYLQTHLTEQPKVPSFYRSHVAPSLLCCPSHCAQGMLTAFLKDVCFASLTSRRNPRLVKRRRGWRSWWVPFAIFTGTVPLILTLGCLFLRFILNGVSNKVISLCPQNANKGENSFHPRVSELKQMLKPSPRSDVPLQLFRYFF